MSYYGQQQPPVGVPPQQGYPGNAAYPPYPPQGYPPQGYPQQGYPPQGYPQQGYPPPQQQQSSWSSRMKKCFRCLSCVLCCYHLTQWC